MLDQKSQLELLIKTLNKTILKEEGEITMSDKEKFEGFKRNLYRRKRAKVWKRDSGKIWGRERREKQREDDESHAGAV